MTIKNDKKKQFELYNKHKDSLSVNKAKLVEADKCKYPDGDCSRCYMVTKVWCVKYLIDNNIITDTDNPPQTPEPTPEPPRPEPTPEPPRPEPTPEPPKPEPTPEPPKPEPTPETPKPEPTPETPKPEPTPEPPKPEPTPEPPKPEPIKPEPIKKTAVVAEIGSIGRIVKWNKN